MMYGTREFLKAGWLDSSEDMERVEQFPDLTLEQLDINGKHQQWKLRVLQKHGAPFEVRDGKIIMDGRASYQGEIDVTGWTMMEIYRYLGYGVYFDGEDYYLFD